MGFIAIDFEASCLPRHGRSFPIEVGICDAGAMRSWLIKPAPAWQGWGWTEEAARLHGIDREILDRDGISPATVMEELAEAVAGARVIADSSLDQAWLNTLAAAAGRMAPCLVEHASLFLDELGATGGEIGAARYRADQGGYLRHRAGDDAAWLWHLLDDVARAASARGTLRLAA